MRINFVFFELILFLPTMTATFMKKIILFSLIIAFAFSTKFTQAQQFDKDFGFRLGAAFYLGDLSGTGKEVKFGPMNIQFNQIGLNFGITGRKFLSPAFAIQGSLNYGRLRGSDNLSQIPEHYTRNLSFRNDIFELAARLEYHFLHLRDVGRTYRYKLGFTSFIFAGAGAFYNNPKANLNGTWYALQPLQTEGVKYSKIQVAIPMGLGFEFRIARYRLGCWS